MKTSHLRQAVKIKRAVSPVSTYINVTVNQPVKEIKKHTHLPRMRKPTGIYSLIKTIQKQREMVSPEVNYTAKSSNLREHFLTALEVPLNKPYLH